MNDQYKNADVSFEMVHKKTREVVVLNVAYICEEYSCFSFSSIQKKYDGINRLPSGNFKEYDIYIIINGEKFNYNGFFISDRKEGLENPSYYDGSFYGKLNMQI